MKKKTVLATILCTLFAVAGCGNAGQADTDAGGNSGADVRVETEVPVDEPDDSGLESQSLAEGDIAALVGTWYEADALDSRTLVIDENGAFTLEYAGGGALYGTIEITTEINPDDTESYWYTFYDQEGEIWESVCIPDEGIQDDMYFGQGGDPHFVRAEDVSMPSFTSDIVSSDYTGVWQCDRCSITVTEGADGFLCEVSWASSASETTEWEYYCDYDDIFHSLVCDEGGVNRGLVYDEDGNEEIFEYYNDGTASFVINEDGYLIWFDDVEDYGNGMEFEKIG